MAAAHVQAGHRQEADRPLSALVQAGDHALDLFADLAFGPVGGLLVTYLLLALAFNLVGDALREEMDPTQKGRG